MLAGLRPRLRPCRWKKPADRGRSQGGQAIGQRGGGHCRIVDDVQDRLVVSVHQHHRLPIGSVVQAVQKTPQAFRARTERLRRIKACVSFYDRQLACNALGEISRFVVLASKTQMHHRMPDRPVPVLVDVDISEQGFIALEQSP